MMNRSIKLRVKGKKSELASQVKRKQAVMAEMAGAETAEVKYDERSLIIEGERKILFSGSIHYPRSTPQMWPSLLAKAKEGNEENYTNLEVMSEVGCEPHYFAYLTELMDMNVMGMKGMGGGLLSNHVSDPICGRGWNRCVPFGLPNNLVSRNKCVLSIWASGLIRCEHSVLSRGLVVATNVITWDIPHTGRLEGVTLYASISLVL